MMFEMTDMFGILWSIKMIEQLVESSNLGICGYNAINNAAITAGKYVEYHGLLFDDDNCIEDYVDEQIFPLIQSVSPDGKMHYFPHEMWEDDITFRVHVSKHSNQSPVLWIENAECEDNRIMLVSQGCLTLEEREGMVTY